jgi:hypothetical protein
LGSVAVLVCSALPPIEAMEIGFINGLGLGVFPQMSTTIGGFIEISYPMSATAHFTVFHLKRVVLEL